MGGSQASGPEREGRVQACKAQRAVPGAQQDGQGWDARPGPRVRSLSKGRTSGAVLGSGHMAASRALRWEGRT